MHKGFLLTVEYWEGGIQFVEGAKVRDFIHAGNHLAATSFVVKHWLAGARRQEFIIIDLEKVDMVEFSVDEIQVTQHKVSMSPKLPS